GPRRDRQLPRRPADEPVSAPAVRRAGAVRIPRGRRLPSLARLALARAAACRVPALPLAAELLAARDVDAGPPAAARHRQDRIVRDAARCGAGAAVPDRAD